MTTIRSVAINRRVRSAPGMHLVGPRQEKNRTFKTRQVLAILTALAAWWPLSVRADDGPNEVEQFLVQKGAQVEVHRRAAGDPFLDVLLNSVAWRVYFVECKGPPPAESCESMTLQAGLSRVSRKSLDVLNTWNASRRFSRAFLDNDAEPALAADVILHDVPGALVDQALGRWIADVDRFRDFLR